MPPAGLVPGSVLSVLLGLHTRDGQTLGQYVAGTIQQFHAHIGPLCSSAGRCVPTGVLKQQHRGNLHNVHPRVHLTSALPELGAVPGQLLTTGPPTFDRSSA